MPLCSSLLGRVPFVIGSATEPTFSWSGPSPSGEPPHCRHNNAITGTSSIDSFIVSLSATVLHTGAVDGSAHEPDRLMVAAAARLARRAPRPHHEPTATVEAGRPKTTLPVFGTIRSRSAQNNVALIAAVRRRPSPARRTESPYLAFLQIRTAVTRRQMTRVLIGIGTLFRTGARAGFDRNTTAVTNAPNRNDLARRADWLGRVALDTAQITGNLW